MGHIAEAFGAAPASTPARVSQQGLLAERRNMSGSVSAYKALRE